MHVVAPLQLAGHRTFRSKNWQRHIRTNSTAKPGVLLSSVVTQNITKVFVPNEGKPSSITTFNLLAFNITWKWRQYNAQKFHAYFEGYGNENGRSWAHVYWKTHLFTKKKKKKKNWGLGQFSDRAGTLNKYNFLSGLSQLYFAIHSNILPFWEIKWVPIKSSINLATPKIQTIRFSCPWYIQFTVSYYV